MRTSVVWLFGMILVLAASSVQAQEPTAPWEQALVQALPQLRQQNQVVIDGAKRRYVARKVRAETRGWPRGDYVELQSTTKNHRPISPGPVVEFRTHNVYRIDGQGGFKELEHRQRYLRPSVQSERVWSRPALVNPRRARQGKAPVSVTEKREVLSAPVGHQGGRRNISTVTYDNRRWEETAVHNRDGSNVTYRGAQTKAGRVRRLGLLFGRRVASDAGGKALSSRRVFFPRRQARRHRARVLAAGSGR
jgi:hypothetical protein